MVKNLHVSHPHFQIHEIEWFQRSVRFRASFKTIAEREIPPPKVAQLVGMLTPNYLEILHIFGKSQQIPELFVRPLESQKSVVICIQFIWQAYIVEIHRFTFLSNCVWDCDLIFAAPLTIIWTCLLKLPADLLHKILIDCVEFSFFLKKCLLLNFKQLQQLILCVKYFGGTGHFKRLFRRKDLIWG